MSTTTFTLNRAATSGTELFLTDRMISSILLNMNASVTVVMSTPQLNSHQSSRSRLLNDFFTLTSTNKHSQIQEVRLRAASADHPLTVNRGPCAGDSAASAMTIMASGDAPGTVAYAQSRPDAVHSQDRTQCTLWRHTLAEPSTSKTFIHIRHLTGWSASGRGNGTGVRNARFTNWQHVPPNWEEANSKWQLTLRRVTDTFQLKLSRVPPKVWNILDEVYQHATELERDDMRGQIHTVLQWNWAAGVATTLQGIWRRRCLYRTQTEDTTILTNAAIFHGRLGSVYLTIRYIVAFATAASYCAEAANLCHIALTQETAHGGDIPRPTVPPGTTLLFFDCGSRGNPGLGGGGGNGNRNRWRVASHTSHTLDGECVLRIPYYQQCGRIPWPTYRPPLCDTPSASGAFSGGR
ncbi:unnamed protein product [Phytophthora fragariaefolia]|uniref:Unnamed protein product n=1 Tax=Phytophthora fragariaefolia TaxID=1490495 RepID=A0A9W6XBT3_9STRA|nr:unnamed protein product [Phytophthora fragariaefolia]